MQPTQSPAVGWLRDSEGKIAGRAKPGYNPLPYEARVAIAIHKAPRPAPAAPFIHLTFNRGEDGFETSLLERNLRAIREQNAAASHSRPEVAKNRKGS